MLRKIPGFRSGKIWKMTIAILGYLILISLLFMVEGITVGDKIIDFIKNLIYLGTIYILVFNIGGIWNIVRNSFLRMILVVTVIAMVGYLDTSLDKLKSVEQIQFESQKYTTQMASNEPRGETKKSEVWVTAPLEVEPTTIENESLDEAIMILIEKGLPQEHATEIYQKVQACGIPLWNSESIIVIEDFMNDDYLLSFRAIDGMFTVEFIIHMLNEEVVSIVDGKMDYVYKDGEINPNYLFHRDINYIGLVDHSKNVIKMNLTSPSTAKFPGSFLDPLSGWQTAKLGNLVEISSYVDCQNSLGATIRTQFLMQYRFDADGKAPLVYFLLNDKAIIDSR